MKFLRLTAVLVVVTVFVCISVTFKADNLSAVGNPINGSGTNGRIARFIGSQCIGDSVIREDGSGNVGVGATSGAFRLLVNGGRFAVNANAGGSLGALVANQNGTGPIATFSKSNGTDIKMVVGNDGTLRVGGTIESTTGGIKFPDGSVQVSAALPTASTFSVTAFGATGDGVNDDTTAIGAALDAAIAQSDAVVFFPVGTYKLTEKIVRTLTSAADSIALVGEGPGISTLVWTNANGGLDITLQAELGAASHNHSSFIVRDLKLVTQSPAGGTGLRIDGQHQQGGNFQNVYISRVTCSQDADGNYWSRGVHLVNLTGAHISDYQYWGEFFGAAGVGIRLEGTGGGFDMTDIVIDNSRFLHFEHAVEVVGEVEGVSVNQCLIVAGLDGINWNTVGGEPLLTVTGTHISVDRTCIFARNLVQCVIQGNLLYQRNDERVSWVAIDLDATSGSANAFFQVCNNIIHAFPDAEEENGIVLDNAQFCQISNNTIHDVSTAIWFRPQVQNSVALDNVLSSIGLVPAILDQGSNNIVRSPGGTVAARGALASRVSPQSIPSGVWTAVQLQSEVYDTGGIWSAGSPSRVTVPAGVSRIRITAGLTMMSGAAAFNVATRSTIAKNGVFWGDGAAASYPGQPIDVRVGFSGAFGSPYFASLSSPVLQVAAGDYFELIILQGSGSPLDVAQTNLKHANATFLSMEVVE